MDAADRHLGSLCALLRHFDGAVAELHHPRRAVRGVRVVRSRLDDPGCIGRRIESAVSRSARRVA